MINKVTLIGRIAAQPELRRLESGAAVSNVSLATSENYKDKSGEWQENTEWHNLTFWREQAERSEKLEKGTLLYIEGKLKTEVWEKEGEKRYTTKIVVSYFRQLSKREANNEQPESNATPVEDGMPF